MQTLLKKRTRAYRYTEITRHPRTQWLYGLCRALPGDRAFLSPSLAKIASRKLDAGVEASGPHDFAVRKQSALVRSAARGHRIQPRVRDDRDTPLEWGGRRGYKVIYDFGKPEYFFKRDWTGRNSLIRLEKLDFARKSAGRAGEARSPNHATERGAAREAG